MLIWFNLQRDRIGNGLPNINNTFAKSLQLQMSVLDQAGLSGLSDGWAKYQQKVPDVSESSQDDCRYIHNELCMYLQSFS